MKKPIDPNLNNNGKDPILGDELDAILESTGTPSHSVSDEIEDILMSGAETPEHKNDEFEIKAYDQSELMEEYKNSHHHHHHHHHHSSHHSRHHHHHSSHHDKKKKMPVIAKILLIILAVILAIVLIVGITFFVLRSQGEKNIKPQSTPSNAYGDVIEYDGKKYRYNDDIVSIAFLGVDQEKLKTIDDASFVGCADADILIAVDTRTGKTNVIAVPRDTMVDVDQYNANGEFIKTGNVQLCLAYAYGDGAEKSCRNVINAMSRILYNIPIEKYYALDLAGVAPLNDAIGGVTLESLYNLPEYGIRKGETVILKGDAAKAYVRTRDMDKITASLNRTDRQVQYVKAYASQILPAVTKRFSVVSDLYKTASDYSQTNLSLSDATYLASLLLSNGITSFETHTIPGEMKEAVATEFPDAVHAEFYPDEDALMETVIKVFYEQAE